jgi:hypothetical protein
MSISVTADLTPLPPFPTREGGNKRLHSDWRQGWLPF